MRSVARDETLIGLDAHGEVRGLTPEDREILKQSWDDLMRGTTKKDLAILRFKKFAAGAGKESVELFKAVAGSACSTSCEATFRLEKNLRDIL
jgi:hypothetical protein